MAKESQNEVEKGKGSFWKRLTLFVIGVCTLILIGHLVYLSISVQKTNTQICDTTKTFLQEIISGNRNHSTDVATGSALIKLNSFQGNKTNISLADCQTKIIQQGHNWALAEATVKVLINPQIGDTDITHLSLRLVNDHGWKIYRFYEVPTLEEGTASIFSPAFALFNQQEVPAGCKTALTKYIAALATNQYQNSTHYVCGMARKSQEMQGSIYNKTTSSLFNGFTIESLTPAYKNDNTVLCFLNGKSGNKPFKGVITFDRVSTNEWKIADLEQI